MDSYLAVANLIPVLPPLPHFLPPFHFFPCSSSWVDLYYDGRTSIILLAAAIVLLAPTASSLSLSPPSAPSLPFRKTNSLTLEKQRDRKFFEVSLRLTTASETYRHLPFENENEKCPFCPYFFFLFKSLCFSYIFFKTWMDHGVGPCVGVIGS